MPILLLMPSLSPTMESGVIADFKKKEGQYVGMGEVFAEIETDKAVMEYELADEGYVRKLLVETGKELQVGEPIAVLAESLEEDIKEVLAESKSAKIQAASPPASPPASPAPTAEASQPQPQPAAANSAAAPTAAPPAAAVPTAVMPTAETGRTKISPYARKLAEAGSFKWQGMKGSGPGGRVIAADIQAALAGNGMAAGKPSVMAVPAADIFGDKPYVDISLGMMRKAIGRKMVEAKVSAPHFQLRCKLRANALTDVRSQLKQVFPDIRVSVNDFVLRACALALTRHPEMNSHFADGYIRRYRQVDLSVAVATEEGLFTPIIVDAANKGLVQLGTEVRALAKKARMRKLTPEEYSGGSFTVSNLGMFGVDEFNAILNVPQVGILAVAGIVDEAVVEAGHLVAGKTMMLTLSCDHRAVDGADAARFMETLRSLLEAPAALAF